MHVVIKGTKTVEEYVQVKVVMEMLTEKLFSMHKQACENWENGKPVKAWMDGDENFCILYENGKQWSYNKKGEWHR